VVGVGKVDSCGAHLVELLTGPRHRIRQVDDVENLGTAEAGDLHGADELRPGVGGVVDHEGRVLPGKLQVEWTS
jgi:hypothetical protein